MAEKEIDQETRKRLPRWLVVAVVVISAAITAAAMSITRLRGPAVAWDSTNKTIETVWSGDQPGVPDDLPRFTGSLPQSTNATVTVGALPGVPVILTGAPLTHTDRGPCTNCHGVVTQQGAVVPAIYALSVMAHEYRGVCINCHQIKIAPAGVAPVAGTLNARPLEATQPVAMGAAAPKAVRQPAEAEWQGLEVGPSAQGVLANGAEGAARTTGMRAGDLVMSINALPIRTMADFVRVTDNGALAQAAVIVRLDGQRLAFELSGGARNAILQNGVPWGAAAAPRPGEAQF